jgi:hypothetical protein
MHPRAGGYERRALDIEPQARPVHVDPHRPRSISEPCGARLAAPR